jgi:hypothetical protein
MSCLHPQISVALLFFCTFEALFFAGKALLYSTTEMARAESVFLRFPFAALHHTQAPPLFSVKFLVRKTIPCQSQRVKYQNIL